MRAVDGGGAVVAIERVGDVAGDRDAHAFHRAAAAVLDEHDAGEIAPAERFGGGDGLAAFQDDGQAAGLRAADAAVDGGAAADPKDAVRRAKLRGGQKQFAGAEAGGVHRIAVFVGRGRTAAA